MDVQAITDKRNEMRTESVKSLMNASVITDEEQ